MKIAIVADWLVTYGGAEHVLASLHALWPAAPIFTTVTRKSELGPLQHADIRPVPRLQHLYRLTKRHQPFLPLMPRALESIDFSGYDVVLSSSHAVGKGVIVPPTARHICYCHTPVRYGWEMEEGYLDDFGIRWPLRKPIKKMLSQLRRWDLTTAQRVDQFIANSTETQSRIKNIYGRESIVIPPPVSDRYFSSQRINSPATYYLALGRLVPYKRFDLLIELANKLKLPLKIGGVGSDLQRLKAMAGPTVEFLGYVPDEALPSLYAGAKALLFPQHEDAGIVPMEAMACGTPVIAFGKGGVVDVIEDSVTGVLVSEQTVSAFEEALKRFETMTFNAEKIRANSMKFHEKEFQKRILEEVGAASSLPA